MRRVVGEESFGSLALFTLFTLDRLHAVNGGIFGR